MPTPSTARLPTESGEIRSIGDLVREVPPVHLETRCELARDRFVADESLLALPVVDANGEVLGILNRFRFLERFAARFGRELAARKPIATLLEPGLVLDEATPLDVAGEVLAADTPRFIFDGFVVTSAGRYRGVGTAFDIFRAVTEHRHAELQHRAHHDSLTGLPNRVLFERRLADAAARADHSRMAAVLFVDLDRFKEINDSFGHRFGDLVLATVAARLRATVRQQDVVARLSGDEFAVVLDGVAGEEDAARVAQVVVRACAAPIELNGHDVAISCSVGIALCPQHATTADSLVRAADAALYGAKEVRNHWRVYESDLHEGRAPVLAGALRLALERGELEVYYQPIVSLVTGRITGVEALVRWTHPQAGPVSAAHIVKLAEDSGLIIPLGRYVATSAVAQMIEWHALVGSPHLTLALNVSALQVREGGLVSWLDRLVEDTGFEPSRLELEFTETGALRGAPVIDQCFHDLSARGYVLTIDDFGTGYSALSRLERLPIDAVKIDRSFVQGIGTPRRGGTIAQAIVAMGQSLGLRVVGEGVETEAQRHFLAAAGCHAAQGYLLGHPQRAQDLTPRLLAEPR